MAALCRNLRLGYVEILIGHTHTHARRRTRELFQNAARGNRLDLGIDRVTRLLRLRESGKQVFEYSRSRSGELPTRRGRGGN